MGKLKTELCRTCLGQDGPFESIFNINEASSSNFSIAKIINISISTMIHISQNDGFSDKICKDCSQKVLEFHIFKLNVEKNDIILKTANKNINFNLASTSTTTEDPLMKVNSTVTWDIHIKKEIGSIIKQEELNVDEKDNLIATFDNDNGELMHEKNISEEGFKKELQIKQELNFDEECKISTCENRLEDEFMQEENMSEDDDNQEENMSEDCDDQEENTSDDGGEKGSQPKIQFEFAHCDEPSFSHQNQIEDHSGEKKYKCVECNKKVTIIKPFECAQCHKKFKLKQTLNRHLVVHMPDKRFECEHCKKKFRYKKSFNQHLLIHTGEQPFECEYCNRKFRVKQSLQRHIYIHLDQKLFECEFCKKQFRHKIGLTDHLLIHRGGKKFECEHCHKKFIKDKHLQTHLLIHTGKREFECEQCNKKFTRKSTLTNHLLIHKREIKVL